jgi:hypothetical protein
MWMTEFAVVAGFLGWLTKICLRQFWTCRNKRATLFGGFAGSTNYHSRSKE